MKEEKLTAVEWLVEQLNNSIGLTKFVDTCDEDYKQEILGIIEQAKEMEKEQIKDAFNQGYTECSIEDLEPKSRERFVDAEDYYHKTFKSE